MKKRAKISIEGIKPLLFHTFPIETLSGTASKQGEDEWKTTVLMDQNRQLYVMNTYLQNAIIGGAQEIKVGRGNLSKKMASTLEVEEMKVFLEDRFVPADDQILKLDSELVYLDVRAVVNPMTKGRVVRYRVAAKAGWICNFHITWDDRIANKEQLKICVDNGGSFQGIGDGRKIGFGRFKVLSFEMVE